MTPEEIRAELHRLTALVQRTTGKENKEALAELEAFSASLSEVSEELPDDLPSDTSP